jgi:hypothetical protein
MSQSWETVVAVALLGTDRQKTLPAILEGNIKTLLDQVDAGDAEGWVLSAAGTLAAYQQAGQKPEQRAERLPEPAKAEAPALTDAAYLPFLRMIFTQGFQPALPEFLSLLQQTGQCLPPEHLPQLLDWGHFHPEVRSHLLPVIGTRGEWLAGLNPKWRYAQATPQALNPEEWKALWETSDRTVRLNLLREWRSQNPEAARELLEATWKQESAKDRAAFLECFTVGLSLADEAFLERGLGDRSKEVRATAIDLLSSLSKSQLSQNIATQISEYIQFRKVDDSLQVEINLPQNDDPKWKNYELDTSKQLQLIRGKQGDRASLLLHLISMTPLSAWEVVGSPNELIHASANHDWEMIVIQGWSFASLRQQSSVWIDGLLQWFKQKSSFRLHRVGVENLVHQLLLLSPAEDRVQWIVTWLDPQCWNNEILSLFLTTVPVPWSLELSQTILSSAQNALEISKSQSDKELAQVKWRVGHYLKPMAYHLHPEWLLTDQAAAMMLFDRDNQTNIFEEVFLTLKFRQQMHQAILVKTDPSG